MWAVDAIEVSALIGEAKHKDWWRNSEIEIQQLNDFVNLHNFIKMTERTYNGKKS